MDSRLRNLKDSPFQEFIPPPFNAWVSTKILSTFPIEKHLNNNLLLHLWGLERTGWFGDNAEERVWGMPASAPPENRKGTTWDRCSKPSPRPHLCVAWRRSSPKISSQPPPGGRWKPLGLRRRLPTCRRLQVSDSSTSWGWNRTGVWVAQNIMQVRSWSTGQHWNRGEVPSWTPG